MQASGGIVEDTAPEWMAELMRTEAMLWVVDPVKYHSIKMNYRAKHCQYKVLLTHLVNVSWRMVYICKKIHNSRCTSPGSCRNWRAHIRRR